jgi:GTP-binding protein YchF
MHATMLRVLPTKFGILLCMLCAAPRCSDSLALSFCGARVVLAEKKTSPPHRWSMKIRIGLVGLPNVGKSSLFNALAQQSMAQAANYPFCTIEPNVARLDVPDTYLRALAGHRNAVPATMEWVDVAGLCKGAHRGEGLGNRFLGTIRDCNAICHVLRVFDDDSSEEIVHHVHGVVNPQIDAQVVNLELLLADLEHVQRRLEKTTCRDSERDALETVEQALLQGIPARDVGLDEDAQLAIKSMGLLTLKPVLYCFNVDEVDFTLGRCEALEQAREVLEAVPDREGSQKKNDCMFTLVSAKLEAKLSRKSEEQQLEYLDSLGVSRLDDLFSHKVLPGKIRELLDLSIVYTGPGVPLERSGTTKAHLFRRGTLTADDLASRLHGDIHKGFLRAEVISAPTLLEYESYAAAKEAGQCRGEGRDYVLDANDVVLVKWKATK